MELETVLNERWSCRGFRPDPVPEETLRAVLDLAQRTPSWCNTQPWHTHLVSGEAAVQLAKVLTEAAVAGGLDTDFPIPAGYHGVYDERRRAAGYALYASLGIERSDRAARDLQMLKNWSFFGAPHVAIITTDRDLGVYGAIDCGGYVANLVNAAHNAGLATVPQAALAFYATELKEFLGIPDDRMVVCGVSIGFADPDHPANSFRTERASVGDAATFVSEIGDHGEAR